MRGWWSPALPSRFGLGITQLGKAAAGLPSSPLSRAPAPGPLRGRVCASVGWGVEDAALTLEGDGKKAGGEDGIDPTTGKQI